MRNNMIMRYTISVIFTLLFLSAGMNAQQRDSVTGQEGKTFAKPVRIVDTLTAAEKASRNPVILQTELDSLIGVFNNSQAEQVIKEPEKDNTDHTNKYLLAGLLAVIALLGYIIYSFYRHQQKINRVLAGLQEQPMKAVPEPGNSPLVVAKEKKGKVLPLSPETRIRELNAELHQLSKENESLNRVIREYNGIQHEYDSLKHGILKAYKVKNYPGYDKAKDEKLAIQGVFQTENSVAAYAYEKFLKPILAITDANKNSPAKLSATDQEKLIDLLVSLSLCYIEYLYLRVNELSVGGTMVERIKGFSSGTGLDAALLKKLNTDFGSRALVLKMALSRTGLHQLSYPVFDETNLNNQ